MPRSPVAVLGGTFDRFHVGHAALLTTAFRVGRSVAIGLTTPEYLAEHPKPVGEAIQPYATRRRALQRWLARHYPRRTYRVVPLGNRFGRSVEDGVDVLVVSADTVAGARAVNAERRRRGRRPLPLVVVPIVLADDLGPVSSRRIRAGAIDRWGHRRAPIRVGLGAGASDRAAASRGIRRAFPAATVVVDRAPGRASADARAAARAALGDRPIALGVVRRGPRQWSVAVRAPGIALAARSVRGDLAAGVARLLTPQPGRKPF